MLRVWKLSLAAIAVACLLPIAVSADGLLPPLPYRYLHPPQALAGENQRPVSGLQVLPASYLRAVATWSVFTLDGQAGVAGKKGSLLPGAAAKAVLIRIDPVEIPPGLPADIAPDGNAYRFTAVNQPDGSAINPTNKVSVTLTWPHIPIALYIYRGGAWKQLCYSDTSLLTGKTMTCPASQLGIFLAVTNPSSSGTGVPTTPASNTRFSWINKYIPLIAALVVVIVAAIAAYVVSRPDRTAPGGK